MNNEQLLEQMKASKIEMIDVGQLLPYALNAKLHTDEQVDELVALMRDVGYTQPILLDGGFEIIAGHGRLLALKKLDMKQAPCIRLPHLTEAQKRAYRLADNQQTMKTGWDMDLLKIELNDLSGMNFDIGMIGFDDDFLNGLLTSEPEPPEEKSETENDDTDNVSKIIAKKRVNPGDFWQLGKHLLVCGDSGNIDLVHRAIGNESGDAIVTDPPYGLSFMGKEWDKGVPSKELWDVWYSRIKPGAHMLSFSGTRTYHLMTIAIENAGFEIRDMMQWIYGSGFPKALDISKAIDEAAGAEREVVGEKVKPFTATGRNNGRSLNKGLAESVNEDGYLVEPITAPATPDAQKWEGWKTALKPANEPICLARKPISESTIAKNVLKHGTGGINIDKSRIKQDDQYPRSNNPIHEALSVYFSDIGLSFPCSLSDISTFSFSQIAGCFEHIFSVLGKNNIPYKDLWPNVVSHLSIICKTQSALIYDYDLLVQHAIEYVRSYQSKEDYLSDCPILHRLYDGLFLNSEVFGQDDFPSQSDVLECISYFLDSKENIHSSNNLHRAVFQVFAYSILAEIQCINIQTPSLSQGRFPANVIFDEAAAEVLDEQTGFLHGAGNKTTRSEHSESASIFGMGGGAPTVLYDRGGGASRFFYVAKPSGTERDAENDHATVKPISLMQYLVRLVCQSNGLVLEPFAGSGTTLLACEREGMSCIGFELDPHHCDIILARWEKLTGKTAEKVS